MKILKFIALILLIIIDIMVAIIRYDFWGFSLNENTVNKISLPELNTFVSVRKMTWGGIDSEALILISSRDDGDYCYDPNTDYIYQHCPTIMYKVEDSVLTIFTNDLSPVPRHFGKKIIVNQVWLSSSEYYKMMCDHKQYGIDGILR